MFKNVFSTVEGINVMPIVVMIFFIAFFVAVLILVFRMDTKFSDYMSNLPLDDDENNVKK